MNGWVLLSLATLGAVCGVAIGPSVVTHSHPQHPTHKVSHKHASHTTSAPPPTQTTPTSTPVTVTTDVTTTQSVATTPKYVVTSKKAPAPVVSTVSSNAATVATKGASAVVSTTSGVTSPQAMTTTVPTTTETTTVLSTTTTVPATTQTTTTPTTTPDPRINMTVCYDVVGCFENYPPFNNANLDLPVDPDVIETGFWLYTRASSDSTDYDVLNYTDPSSVTASRFDPKKLTKVVVHGFNNNGNTTWVQRFRQQFLRKGDFNVIVVDWGRGAKFGNYDQAVANTRLVGTQLRLILEMLMGAGLHLEDVHLLGHSLGAHTSGYTGRLFGGKISRISGMDPADPEFKNYPLIVRLDKTDAQFVDVTHTSVGTFGIETASGHVDFYINGGSIQAGCPKGLITGAIDSLFGGKDVGNAVSCSHGRSHDFYIESILTSCPFTAYPCSSYDAFQRGQCLTCGQRGCTQYGYYCDQYFARGKMYLNTASKSPFCGFHYGIELSAPSSVKETMGKLSINLIGQWGSTGFIQMTGDDTLRSGGQVVRVVVASKEVGDITAVQVKYVKHSGFWFGAGEDNYAVSRVAVTSGENGSKYMVCGKHSLPHNNAVRMTVSTKVTC